MTEQAEFQRSTGNARPVRLGLSGKLLLLTALFMLWTVIACRRRGLGLDQLARRFSLREKFSSLPRVLPFLAILWFCHSKLAMTRKSAIVVAWLGAALIFGALHLPTYGWNFVQCFLVIGTARIVLLVGYIVTKNIWVSTGAHIINDWLIFTVMALAISPDAGTA